MPEPDTTSRTFKVDLKTELPYWLLLLPCMFLIGIITKQGFLSAWPLMVVVTVLIVSFSILLFRLNSIEIDATRDVVILTEANLLGRKKIKNYPLDKLQFTYKRGKPGLRHRMVNICRLYINDKQVAEIIPDHDGWTDDSVNDLAKGLVKAGVPKKFIGYSVKDAEIKGV